MSAVSKTTLKCDWHERTGATINFCVSFYIFEGDAGQTRARAKKEGWLVAHVTSDPLRPFKVRRQDFCPGHNNDGKPT